MRLLLHICCANCAIYPIKILSNKFDSVALWYNPNIHPYAEYQKRLMTVGYLMNYLKKDIIYDNEYNILTFFKGVIEKEEEGKEDVQSTLQNVAAGFSLRNFRNQKVSKKRCEYCYYIRLKRTIEVAIDRKFDYFTTTLLSSTTQEHNLIKDIGEELSARYGVKFYYEDFRVGKKEAYKVSKELGLYRQDYCGCIFSEVEKYGSRPW